jgi:hypothetical protein
MTLLETIRQIADQGYSVSFGQDQSELFGPGIDLTMWEYRDGMKHSATYHLSTLALDQSILGAEAMLVICLTRMTRELDRELAQQA